LPLPQIPGFTVYDMRMVPLLTRATLLAMLCAGATLATVRAARATLIVLLTELIVVGFIC